MTGSQDDPKADTLATNPTMLPHHEAVPEHQPAEQGPPPADFETRPVSGAPLPSGQSLSVETVEAMTGDEGATATNIALEGAEGLDTES